MIHTRGSIGIILLIITSLIVVGGAGWYVSQQSMLSGSSTEVTSATTSPQNAGPVPSEADTVITEASTPIGEFTGYYESFERASDGESMKTCDALVVLKGAPKLTQYFKDMVQVGNTVQSVTAQGQLRINLPWNEVPEADKAVIQASTPDNPITLSLKKSPQEGRGVGACYSFFSYIRIES